MTTSTSSSFLQGQWLHGTYTNTYNTPADPITFDPHVGSNIVESGRLDLRGVTFDAQGNPTGGATLGGAGLNARGDGSTETASITAPWATWAVGNTFVYELELVAFARARNPTGADENVFIDSDYADTGEVDSIQLFDANGNDITNIDHLTFASGAPPDALTTTPEPATLSLSGIGLAALATLGWRQRRSPQRTIDAQKTDINSI